jgi:hypothetical protein
MTVQMTVSPMATCNATGRGASVGRLGGQPIDGGDTFLDSVPGAAHIDEALSALA